jgi:hypothetical protein
LLQLEVIDKDLLVCSTIVLLDGQLLAFHIERANGILFDGGEMLLIYLVPKALPGGGRVNLNGGIKF